MLKRIALFAVAALLVAGFTFAADTTASTPAAPAKMPKAPAPKMVAPVMGTIDKIDTTAKTISVTVGTESKSFTYGSHTTFWSGKKKVKVEDLKAGDKITVTADSANMIHKLAVTPAAPASK